VFSRRHFLKAAGSAAILPAVLPGYAARSSGAAANNRINFGVIGMGWLGPGNTKSFLASDDCQVVAACDIDADPLQAAVKMMNDYYGTEDCKGYHDYRELLTCLSFGGSTFQPGLVAEDSDRHMTAQRNPHLGHSRVLAVAKESP
jgi:hypothetical protein